jgi:hypothetical protein
MTERQTNASNGKVVSMFRPKQLPAIRNVNPSGVNWRFIQSRDVNDDVIRREVVQDIALSL